MASSIVADRGEVAGKTKPLTKQDLVASSILTDRGEVAGKTKPLTKQDLVAYLASGCKPREQWRIGTEHEKFGFDVKSLRPVEYERIAQLMEVLAQRFGWEREYERENLIGLKMNGGSISLEPGGQFELSGAPVETLHHTYAEVQSHLRQVKTVAEEMGIGFLGMGFNPMWPVQETPRMPKAKFEIVSEYMPKVGEHGLDIMFRTCTVQVNLDYSSEQDLARKLQVGLALQPIATAIFASSPFADGKPSGYLSYRSQAYLDTDEDRTGDLPFAFSDQFSFEDYVDYALDIPMFMVIRKDRYIDCCGMSFKDFMNGKLPNLPGEYPTMQDWEHHLGSIYPEVRLKRFLEMRGADCGPLKRICALPAFWVGLLYDEESLQGALDIIQDWTEGERDMLRKKVPKLGLQTPFRDGLLKDVAKDVFQLAKEGLQRRGHMESIFLDEIEETVNSGKTLSEELLELYNGKWGRKIEPLFEEFLL
ncbi:hypothetical protein R1flu_003681 [Riccia fluitans]|uniref:Glutamate--cysteine ligase n=1 Tax=Riccia fluitans TaxID=41844 RepID=A0ABD1YA14_9MARC